MHSLGALITALILPAFTFAAEIDVRPGPKAITSTLVWAADGDRLILRPGIYTENIVLDRPVTLQGAGDVIIDGNGIGSTITVNGPDVVIRGLTIIGSGSAHETIDAGIKLTKTARRPVIENNRLQGNLYGIDIHGAKDALVTGNKIEGRQDHRMNERGNGIYVWNAPGAVVDGNTVRWGRDGIFVNTSHSNTFTNNEFRDLRFGVHYMYANNSEISGNLSVGNHLGYALMFSKKILVRDNISVDDRDHGLMFNFTTQSDITGNYTLRGKQKCAFFYNSHKNNISGNRFEGCNIGIHFTAGSKRNQISGNAFVGNRTQVKYVSTQWEEWSADGQGNYWSDFAAYDVDGDGVADTAYRPNDSMDLVLWTQPAAKLLLGSPAVQLVRWSQAAFPALLPGGVIDSAPMMRPVEIALPEGVQYSDG
jgi:nitrous oxidase accessory protein